LLAEYESFIKNRLKRNDDNMIHLVATFEAVAVHQTYIAEYDNREFDFQTLGPQLVDNGNQIFSVQLIRCLFGYGCSPAIAIWGFCL
jgi:hypothetical protein